MSRHATKTTAQELLLGMVEKMPASALFRRVSRECDAAALIQIQNEAHRQLSFGLGARWGLLGYAEIAQLLMTIELRVDALSKAAVRRHNIARQRISERPYLAPELMEHDPHGKKKNIAQDPQSAATTASTRRPSRRRARSGPDDSVG